MDIELTPYEARIIGCLIEKEITTPDQYPLSLNAIVNACNQKSNRDPVLDLDEAAVQQVVDALIKEHLVMEKSGYGNRVPKYQHRFCNSEFGELRFSPQALGIVCELLLRGPQTPGELRTHTARLCQMRDVQEVEAALKHLAERDDGPFVVRLAREPGRREARYAHLFSGDVQTPVSAPVPPSPREISGTEDGWRVRLEQRIEELAAEVAALKERVVRLEDSNPSGAAA